jgi:hypothetical protein
VTRFLLLLTSAALVGGCATHAQTDDVAAVIINASSQTHDEIRRDISMALNGAPVTIAPDALTKDSFVAIERKPVSDQQGLLVNGRDTGRPEIFDLRKKGRLCTLVQRRTEKRITLALARCTAA